MKPCDYLLKLLGILSDSDKDSAEHVYSYYFH